MKYSIVLFCLFLLPVFIFSEDDLYQEFSIKRKQIFEFTQKPKITEKKDKISIEFEVKDYCDVTVAIENKQGKILRHLASGVLGDKAPQPFTKNSLKQNIIWDGKNDKGRYLDNRDDINIRVSLGLKADFDKSLKTKYPAKVIIHKKTQEIYILSWPVIGLSYILQRSLKYDPKNVKQTLTNFSAFPECKLKSSEPIELGPGNRAGFFTISIRLFCTIICS